MQVDRGAIRFVLSGANIMCPGLTSPGAQMTNVEKSSVVVSFPQQNLQRIVFREYYTEMNKKCIHLSYLINDVPLICFFASKKIGM